MVHQGHRVLDHCHFFKQKATVRMGRTENACLWKRHLDPHRVLKVRIEQRTIRPGRGQSILEYQPLSTLSSFSAMTINRQPTSADFRIGNKGGCSLIQDRLTLDLSECMLGHGLWGSVPKSRKQPNRRHFCLKFILDHFGVLAKHTKNIQKQPNSKPVERCW